MLAKVNLILLGALFGLGGLSYGLPKMISPSNLKSASAQKNKLARKAPAAASVAAVGAGAVANSQPVALTEKEMKSFVDPVEINSPASSVPAEVSSAAQEFIEPKTPPVPQPSILSDVEKKNEFNDNWANAAFLPQYDDPTAYDSESNADLEDQVLE